jgi:hypothetical protein
MQRIVTVAKYQKAADSDVKHLLIAANKDWIECDKLTHSLAWKTITSGGVFFSSERISK